MAEVRAEFNQGLAQVRGELNTGLAEVRLEFRTELANQRADLIKWMFIFWAGTVVPLAGLAVALNRL